MVSIMNNQKNYIQQLSYYINRGIISFEDAMSLSEDKLMNKILKQVHPYSIFYSESDNRWHTTIADETNIRGRKPIARKKKSDLEKFLFEHYNLHESCIPEVKKTFEEIFDLVQERKLQFIKDPEKLLSAQNTQIKARSDYKRYFANTDFATTPIDEITKKDVEQICLYNLTRYDLKKKAFASLRGILKSVFDMAYSEYWISDNLYQRMDFNIFKNLYTAETPIEERIHSDQEVSAIINELHRKEQSRPKYSSVWALEMQILMGARRGELPALTWDDITDTCICISKEQLTTGNDFVIVNHTKNYKTRFFPLTKDLKDFLSRLKIMHDKYYPDSKYLFPADTDNGAITNRAVYLVYRKICHKLGIEIQKDNIRGPHSFRRNAITDVVNKTNGNIVMASELFGNTPEVAKKNYFTGTDLSIATTVLDERCLLAKSKQK